MLNNIDEAIAIAQALNETPAVTGDAADIAAGILTDAHKYTRTLIREGFPTMQLIDDQFLHSNEPAIPMTRLIELIQQHAARAGFAPQQLANISQVLTSILALVNSPTAGVENSETMVNIYEILLRTWNLAGVAAERRNEPALLTQVVQCLEGNVSDAGGCLPGIVARLYPAYARLVNNELRVQQQGRRRATVRNTFV
jgi:hypothetical protein